MEQKGPDRLKIFRVPLYLRKDTYKPPQIEWAIKEDLPDEERDAWIEQLIASKESTHIDGLAGTGKPPRKTNTG